MDTLRLILLLVVCACACVVVRLYRPEYAVVLTLCIGTCTLLCLLPQLRQMTDFFFSYAQMGTTLSSFANLILKIMGIAYLAQFAADICVDCGEKAMAQKVTLAARVGILVLCLPILQSITQILFSLLDELP